MLDLAYYLRKLIFPVRKVNYAGWVLGERRKRQKPKTSKPLYADIDKTIARFERNLAKRQAEEAERRRLEERGDNLVPFEADSSG